MKNAAETLSQAIKDYDNNPNGTDALKKLRDAVKRGVKSADEADREYPGT
jgi:hypothetical protein